MSVDSPLIETHPFPPFVPKDSRLLVMGTFPPQPKRWSMDFYYPNRTNDFWFMMGLYFYGNKNEFFDSATKSFRLAEIKSLLQSKGIALSDTGRVIRRLKDNASDKFLEILETADLRGLLLKMPECHDICTTGEKAAKVIAGITNTEVPATGSFTECKLDLREGDARSFRHWRMPSTSRAYPLALEKKTAAYAKMFRYVGLGSDYFEVYD